jgi:hypothetical protein
VAKETSRGGIMRERGIRPVRGRVSGTIVCGVAVNVGWCCVDECCVDEGCVAVDRRNDCCWRGDVITYGCIAELGNEYVCDISGACICC